MKEKNVAAFFDIDGTIYREGLITELFKKLIKHELIDENNWANNVKPAFQSWVKRKGHYDDYLDRMVEIYIKSIIGLKRDHIELIAHLVIEQKGDRVYRFTRNEIMRNKLEGNRVIAISGSPYELVEEMAKKYEFDDFRGTVYVKDEDDRYTGEMIPMWDKVSKKKAIMELVEKYNLNLDECFGYGDTTGDLTMLGLVGHPFAINPTKGLLDAIKADENLRKKITVIVERKDMIYKLPIDAIDTEWFSNM